MMIAVKLCFVLVVACVLFIGSVGPWWLLVFEAVSLVILGLILEVLAKLE